MKKQWLILLVAGMMGYTTNAQNVGGIWLSGTGIASEGTGLHNGETQVMAIEDSIMNTISGSGSGAGAGAGKIVFGNFKFKKAQNANTLPFFNAACRGTVIPTLNFKFYQPKLLGTFAAGYTITLSNVMVTKYRVLTTDCTGNNCPTAVEEITLYYDKIQYTDNAGNTAQYQATAHF